MVKSGVKTTLDLWLCALCLILSLNMLSMVYLMITFFGKISRSQFNFTLQEHCGPKAELVENLPKSEYVSPPLVICVCTK